METSKNTTARKRAPTIQQQAAALKNPAIIAAFAALEDPTLPECMLWCARKRLDRLEGKRCQDGTKQHSTTTTGD